MRLCMVPGSVPEKKFWCNAHSPEEQRPLFRVPLRGVYAGDLSLVDGGPERRRTFLDMCSAQLHAPMLGLVRRYQLAPPAAQRRVETAPARIPGRGLAAGLGQTAGTAGNGDRRPAQHLRAGGWQRSACRCMPGSHGAERPSRSTISPACSAEMPRKHFRSRRHPNWCGSTAKKCARAVPRISSWDTPAAVRTGRPVPRHRRQAGKGVRLTGTEKKPGAVTETGAGGDLQQAPEGIAGSAAG